MNCISVAFSRVAVNWTHSSIIIIINRKVHKHFICSSVLSATQTSHHLPNTSQATSSRMGLIKKAIAIGGIYYVAKKVTESQKEPQHANAQQQNSNASNFPQQQQQQTREQSPMNTSRAVGHQSYCNGQCGGQCSFTASEQHGYEAKAPVYEEKAALA